MANQQKSSSSSLSFSNQPLCKGVNGTPIGGGVTGGKKPCKTRKTRSIWYSQGALPWTCRISPNPAPFGARQAWAANFERQFT